MKRLNAVLAVFLATLVVGCLIAAYETRDSGQSEAPLSQRAPRAQATLVDSSLLDTAQQLSTLAETEREQNQASEAVHLADHELDQAFATALRDAASYHPPTTGPLRNLAARIDQLRTQVAADQSRVTELTKQTPSASATGQLELAKAQLALEQDELDDAQQDLARQGGDPHAVLERDLQEHEATRHQNPQSLRRPSPSPPTTLVEQTRAWVSLGSQDRRLLAAAQQATERAGIMSSRHSDLEKRSGSRPEGAPQSPSDTTAAITALRELSAQTKALSELDHRIQDCQQLAGVYKTWSGLIETRRRGVAHLLLESIAAVAAILLLALFADLGIRRAFRRSAGQRQHQLRVIASVALQATALVVVLLALFGVPNQASTIIGFATAGLTVVFRDFIAAFFGWFTLMGKNGMRVGDWVEINGVSGEVIEMGLLKTVLLELGNLTDTGHPTGRRVAFSNSFAMEGHYFNFSTSGQWLWDELVVNLPTAGDPYATAREIYKLVEAQTGSDVAQAAKDWERATSQYGARTFSAKPAVDLRPGVNGLEVVVRYIARAPERYALRSKLFQLIVELLHKPSREPAVVDR